MDDDWYLYGARIRHYCRDLFAMCLFAGQGYEEVAWLLTEGLAWAARWSRPWQVPTTAAISRARVKLGVAP